jgi:hypothetical protein
VTDEELNKLITSLAAMSRQELKAMLESLRTRFPMDFTEEFLAEIPVDKLRHVTLAACLHAEDPLTRCV